MVAWIRYCLGMLLIINCYAESAMTTLPSGVVKVNKENNPHCVEYLLFKGEMYCSAVPLEKKTVNAELISYENQKIQFDQRIWKAAWGKKNNAIATVEYLPAGDNIDNWHELVTSQYIPGLKDTSPGAFMQHFINNLKKSNLTYSFSTLEKHPGYILFEFKVIAPSNLQQNELLKITRGKDGLYLIHYAVSKPEMTQEERNKWISNLKKSTIK